MFSPELKSLFHQPLAPTCTTCSFELIFFIALGIQQHLSLSTDLISCLITSLFTREAFVLDYVLKKKKTKFQEVKKGICLIFSKEL